MWRQKRFWGGFAVFVLLVIGGIADVLDIVDWLEIFGESEARIALPAGGNGSVSPGPTPTPTVTPPLDKQLAEAMKIRSDAARGAALLIVAQHAVDLRDYSIAIEAASKTPSDRQQASTLALVVRCAIEDGFYDDAAHAADKVRIWASGDSLRTEVIAARRKSHYSDVPDVVGTHLRDRRAMACLLATE